MYGILLKYIAVTAQILHWKLSIIPLKAGLVKQKTFCGITLNNILSKIYSKLLVGSLIKWADKHEKFIDNRYGFQENKSTIT